jgi:hypothetical protein
MGELHLLIVKIPGSISCELFFIHIYRKGMEIIICTTLFYLQYITCAGLSCSEKASTRCRWYGYSCCSHKNLQRVKWVMPMFNDTLRVMIPGVSFTTSRISSYTLGVVVIGHTLLATQDAKFLCSLGKQWILPNVFLFVLDTFHDTNNELPQHYCPPYHTWNACRLAPDLSTSSQQLSFTTHSTRNYCTLLLLRFGNFLRLCQIDTMKVLIQCEPWKPSAGVTKFNSFFQWF